jgi:hypothetical protein
VPVGAALAAFRAAAAQSGNLIANAHQVDANGASILPEIDRKQVTVAAFLNLFIGWEGFLEDTMAALLCGANPLSGNAVVKFASPPDAAAAKKMIIGANPYFDYANHERVIRVAKIYFDQGAPFLPHLATFSSQLSDLKIMRNSSAHITSSTQNSLETLALRLLATPSIGIELYTLLTAADPAAPGATIYQTYKDQLLATATLVATG